MLEFWVGIGGEEFLLEAAEDSIKIYGSYIAWACIYDGHVGVVEVVMKLDRLEIWAQINFVLYLGVTLDCTIQTVQLSLSAQC